MLNTIKAYIADNLPKPEDKQAKTVAALDVALADLQALTCGTEWGTILLQDGSTAFAKNLLLAPNCTLSILVGDRGSASLELFGRGWTAVCGSLLQLSAADMADNLKERILRWLDAAQKEYDREQEFRANVSKDIKRNARAQVVWDLKQQGAAIDSGY